MSGAQDISIKYKKATESLKICGTISSAAVKHMDDLFQGSGMKEKNCNQKAGKDREMKEHEDLVICEKRFI